MAKQKKSKNRSKKKHYLRNVFMSAAIIGGGIAGGLKYGEWIRAQQAPSAVSSGASANPVVREAAPKDEFRDIVAGTAPSLKPTASGQTKNDNGISVRAYEITLQRGQPFTVALRQAGLDSNLRSQAESILSDHIDFRRDFHPGNVIRLLVADNQKTGGKNIHLIGIEAGYRNRIEKQLFRYDLNGRTNYYDTEGGRGALLLEHPFDPETRKKIRITSKFGNRRHPTLGEIRPHNGVDYGGRGRSLLGQPIVAAGDGIVEYVGVKGASGRYIRIRHANGYKTSYAHLQGYEEGLKKGMKVTQGQRIGYVGSSGRSNGPHLHYEVTRNDQHLDPLSITPPQEGLEGQELANFRRYTAELQQIYTASLDTEIRLAEKKGSSGPAFLSSMR